jgi:uncharacterized repeat protein (TIGR03803 family)
MSAKSLHTLAAALLAASSFAFAQAPTEKVLHEFNGADKASPSSNLIQVPNGDYVGMTGAPLNQGADSGGVYLLTPSGGVKTLYAFASDGSQCASGAPTLTSTGGGIMQASDGSFYGVCAAGGASGMGAIFSLTQAGVFTLLHSFSGSDGSQPGGALVEGLDGNLYGVTLEGGLDPLYGGTVFRVGKHGPFTSLYLFNYQTGASNPTPGLAPGPNGNLYGAYKAYQILNGAGIGGVFVIGQSGNVGFPAQFQAAPSGCAAVFDSTGAAYALNQISNFVGNNGSETLEVIPAGSDFANIALNLPPRNGRDVANIAGCMILGTDGLFYANGISAIAKPVNPWVEIQMDLATQTTTFFDLKAYGEEPVLSPLEGSDGRLYIVNNGGGTDGLGNVLALDYGLAPPLPVIGAFQPTSGSAGTAVTVGGNYFVGVTAVTLNGNAVPFKVMSSGYLVFKVPAGATGGAISVTTANGTGTSVGTFTVE